MSKVVAARCDVQKCDQNATINAGGVIVLLATVFLYLDSLTKIC